MSCMKLSSRLFILLIVLGPSGFVCQPLYASETAVAWQTEIMPLLPQSSDIGSRVQKDVRERVYSAAQRQARYLLSLVHPWAEDESLLLITESRSREHWIRPNTGTLAGFAFLYRFGEYDEQIVGVSRAELLEKTMLPMFRYLIATHLTGVRPTSDGKRWGDAWQSAHWAHQIGRAGWWIWEDLPEDIRAGLRKVVAHEAERFVKSEPPHQIQLDTKAEENAWNSQIFSVAVLLMPEDPRRAAWEAAFPKWALSSFLRPADEHSTAVVDGLPVAEQFSGANIYDDFTLENHRIVHPDYMTTFSLSLGCALDYVMTGRRVPQVLLYNTSGIYQNLKWFSLLDGGFVYPSGQDWRLFRNPDWLFTHLLMALYGKDPSAWELSQRCLATLEKMQARSDSGAVYRPEEFFFASTHSDTIYSLSKAWLALHRTEVTADRYEEPRGVLRLEAGKIVLNRTKEAIHTFSWGKKIMAQCLPNRRDRIVSPHTRNGVGWIRLKGAEDILPIRVDKVTVEETGGGFNAELVLDHGDDAVRAFLNYRSGADGRLECEEKLVAMGAVEVAEVATGLVGVLNHPNWVYEKGHRVLDIDGDDERVETGTGKTFERTGVTRIAIDDCLKVASETPLRVKYVGAVKPERARMTDLLILNYQGEEKEWKKGDVISSTKYVMRAEIE